MAWLRAVVGCDGSPRTHVNEFSPRSLLPRGRFRTPMGQLHYGWSCYIMRAETTILYQKLMNKGKSESSHPYSLPHLFFQCKYFMSTNRSMLGMPLLFTPLSSYLSVNHQTIRAIYAEQIQPPIGMQGPRSGQDSAGRVERTVRRRSYTSNSCKRC